MNKKRETVEILTVCVHGQVVALRAFGNIQAAVNAWEIVTERERRVASLRAREPHLSDEQAGLKARSEVDHGELSGTELWAVSIEHTISEKSAADLRRQRDEALDVDKAKVDALEPDL